MIKTVVTRDGCAHIEMTPEEVAAIQAQEADWLVKKAAREPLEKIAALEAQQTPRRIREAAIGKDNGWLADLDAQIAALRAKP